MSISAGSAGTAPSARTFDVSGINESGITAAYNNGILEVTLPKQAPVVPESRQIAIL